LFFFKKKIKALWRRASKDLQATHDEATFETSNGLVALWGRLLETEVTINSVRLEFLVNSGTVTETLTLKEKEVDLTEREIKYLEVIKQLLAKIDESQAMSSDTKALFRKREEKAEEKLTRFTKAVHERTQLYKNTGIVLGKNCYKKDHQRFSSIQNLAAKIQTLTADNRTVIEQFNDLRRFLSQERDITYQKHVQGVVWMSFLRKFGILNSCLVEIYDEILLAFPEMESKEYSLVVQVAL